MPNKSSLILASLFVVAALFGCMRKPEPPGTGEAVSTLPVVARPDVVTPVVTPDATAPGGTRVVHRATAETCSATKVQGNVEVRVDGDRSLRPGRCAKDSECTAGKNGRCSMVGGGRLPPQADCVYDACYNDADCGTKSACECHGSANEGHECMGGNCAVDADCGAGGLCSPSLGHCGNYGGVIGNFCHVKADECSSDADCNGKPEGHCAFKEEVGHWQCAYGHCVG